MKDLAGGLTALEIINPNARMAGWLNGLRDSGAINRESAAAAARHFGLKRGRADWLLFFKRIFVLMGVVFSVCGLIFFMAWNWEDLSRFAKFASLELVFIIFGAYCVLRWPGAQTGGRWDARVALLGAALSLGGLLALYGQVYQTGADAWELFRAWAVILFFLALAGRATAFWFLVWLTGSLWIGLYLGVLPELEWNRDVLILLLALAQFLLLAVNEAAARLLNRRGLAHDPGRWLSRIVGCAAIGLMSAYAVTLAISDWTFYRFLFVLLYFLSLGLSFYVYYKLLPELLFLALTIFSLAAFLIVRFSYLLLDNILNIEAQSLLLIGIFIIGLVFASLKLILILGGKLRERARRTAAETLAERAHGDTAETPAERTKGPGRSISREARQAELRDWLIGRDPDAAEAIAAWFTARDRTRELESPWYVLVFVSLGVWIGSILSLGAFTYLIFDSLGNTLVFGLAGLTFCALSIQLGPGQKLGLRALSQVIGIYGLLYAAMLFDFAEKPTCLLLTMLFLLFWLLKPPFAARLGAFLGAAACAFLFLTENPFLLSFNDPYGTGLYLKTALYCLGLLWAAHYLIVMEERPPAFLEAARARWPLERARWLTKRFKAAEALGASAYAGLIFCAALAIILPNGGLDLAWLRIALPWGTAIVFAALTGLICLRYPAARAPALPLGLLLTLTAWFVPYLAVGVGLVLLAFHTGRNAFLGAAVAYLGCATWLYYYNLELSLLYKSLALMGNGAVFLALGLILSRRRIKEEAQ